MTEDERESPSESDRRTHLETRAQISTLNMMFRVTYCLELRNAISIYYTSHVLSTNVELVSWTL